MTISLAILGRAPLAGYAKTRLIPLLGAEGAARAQEILLTRIIQVARNWKEEPGRDWHLWCAPDAGHSFFRSLVEPARLRSQPAGDLGERLTAIHRRVLAEAEAVILLGADAASIGPQDLAQAAAALQEVPAVLAPAEDGGYVLLGLRAQADFLFDQMPWGTDQVARITRQRLALQGWPWRELAPHWDVDTPDDWQRFLEQYHP